MLIFWPTSVFISVDLPTFGRPTIAIMPQRNGVSVELIWVFSIRRAPERLSAGAPCRRNAVSVGRERVRRDGLGRFGARLGRRIGRVRRRGAALLAVGTRRI